MTTERQLLANRTNALKSSGAKTAAGKRTSSRNAIKHGLFAKDILLRDEDPEQYETFSQQMLEDLDPVGAVQVAYVKCAVQLSWRLGRYVKADSSLYEWYLTVKKVQGGVVSAFLQDSTGSQYFTHLSRYARTLLRKLLSVLRELEKLKAQTTQPQRSGRPAQPQPQEPALGTASFLSEHLLLSNEDPAGYGDHLEAFQADLKPVGVMQRFQVELLTITVWQLSRMSTVEPGVYEFYRKVDGADGGVGTAFAHQQQSGDVIAKYDQLEANLFRLASMLLAALRS